MRSSIVACSLVVVCLLVLMRPSWAQEYDVIDLGTLGGTISGVNSVSEGGIIAGYATTASGVKHPVRWVDRVIQDLGSPPGFNVGEAVDANDAGQVAVTGEGSPQSYRGFLWENNDWTDLGLLAGRNECIPEAIDGVGRIVGTSLTLGGGDAAAFIWEAGEMNDLGTLSGTARAYGINQMGQVVGHCWANQPGGGGEQQAFLWENDSMIELTPLPDRDHAQAFDINDLGDVAGSSWYPTGPYSLSVDRATLWLEGGNDIRDLGYTPGPPVCSNNPYYPDNVARAVNNHGQVVGHAQCIASGGSLAAFLWQDGAMHNLNDLIPPGSGWELIKALDINDAGEIVGFGLAPGGGAYLRAFLLVPLTTSINEGSHAVRNRSSLRLRASPNPFRLNTRISYSLLEPGRTELTVHDVLGRKVATLVRDAEHAGAHMGIWNGVDEDGRAVPAGVYLLRLVSNGLFETRRVILLK